MFSRMVGEYVPSADTTFLPKATDYVFSQAPELRGEKSPEKKFCLNQVSNPQLPGHESDTLPSLVPNTHCWKRKKMHPHQVFPFFPLQDVLTKLSSSISLTFSQKTNFRFLQTETVCRRNF